MTTHIEAYSKRYGLTARLSYCTVQCAKDPTWPNESADSL
jgi:hypothetical protein